MFRSRCRRGASLKCNINMFRSSVEESLKWNINMFRSRCRRGASLKCNINMFRSRCRREFKVEY